MRQKLKIVAAVLVGVAATAALAAYWFRPTVLHVAAGPVGSSDVRVIVSYLQAFQRERADVRLRLVLAESPADAAAKLESRRASLAIVRSDIAIPAKSSTVAIMRKEAVFFLTRPGSGVSQIPDLKGKTVGLVRTSAANERIFSQVLAQNDISIGDITRVSGTPPEMQQAVQEGRIDALFFVTPLNERVIRAALQTFPKVEGQSPGLLAVSEAEALVADHPALDTVEILRGAFGANPVLPESAMTTLAVTHRLVAHNELSESVVSELTRLLVTLRPQVVREAPQANQIDLPSTEDRAARLPTHPGAVAYIDGETKTFFERYGDYIYIGIMGASILGSALAALFSTLMRRPESAAPDQLMRDLVAEMDRVRQAETTEALDAIEEETEGMIARLLQVSTGRGGDNGQVAAVALLVSEFRHTLARRRHNLLLAAGGPEKSGNLTKLRQFPTV
ncbi:MAG: ABC transporter substrate-binding protein [Rhizobiales bacterium]|nr:ABC transporter substrate-binding protein [Hyphomicrobiales bacterium]